MPTAAPDVSLPFADLFGRLADNRTPVSSPAPSPAPHVNADPEPVSGYGDYWLAPPFPSRAAMHEAAHAVVAHRLGLGVYEVGVEADGSGYTAIEYQSADPTSLACYAVACAAGPVVYEKFRQAQVGCADDVAQVRDLSARYASMTGRVLRPWSVARAMVRTPEVMADIGRLAGAIRIGQRMSRDDVAAVLGPHLVPYASA